MLKIRTISPRGLTASALCAALLLVCIAARGDEMIEAKPAEKPGVSIQLPKGWQTDEHVESHVLLKARAPGHDSDSAGEFQALLTICSDAGAKIDGAAQQSRVAREVANYKIVEEPAKVSINGLEAVKFGGTLTAGPVKVHSRQYMVLHDSHIYTLTFMSLETRWSAYAEAVEASAQTFRIPAK